VGHPASGLRDPADVLVVQVDAVGQPHVGAQISQVVQKVHRPPTELLHTEPFLVRRLGDVRVKPHAQAASELRRLPHEALGCGERGTGSDRQAEHGPGRRVVMSTDRLLRLRQHGVGVLYD
jgi:hypothetical protein